ncbi:MAG TPA: pilus assembly protein TadG-related protein [Bryobacteraceae bacterium]|nr:pilus assembly protein TadG-related protein [Bryobacteraceae bacterium]
MRLTVRRRKDQAGYYLVALTLSLPFILGASALAIDIGRMYITKSEVQDFVDSAVLTAASKLDGTAGGVANAQAAAGSNPKGWSFGINAFAGAQTSFSTTSAGPWTTSPPNPPTSYNYVQVTATVNLPMYLMGIFSNRNAASIGALAVAGRVPVTSIPGGEFPFSVYTRAASPDNAGDPYGFQVGNQYTLRWGSPGTSTKCGTDATKPNLSTSGSVRGYCCVAESGATLRQAIVGALTDPLTISQPTPMMGAKNTETAAIAQRVAIDSDPNTMPYAAYRSAGNGNGERVVLVPVNGGAPNYPLEGFAGFFLSSFNSYVGLNGNDSACAEYIGAWVGGQPVPPTGQTGAYHLKLYQ